MDFLAQAANQGSKGGNSPLPMFVLFGLMFVIMYFFILRPQRKKDRERRDMLSRVRKQDHIVTTGGIHGVVVSVKENELLVRVDDAKDIKLRVDKSAVTALIEAKDDED